MIQHKTPSFRQIPAQAADKIYDDGFLRVEHENYYVECEGVHLKLSRGEFLIISLLTQKAERYVTAEYIWRYIWSDSRPVNVESLKVVVSTLRRKLKPFQIKIETMANVGYRLAPHSREKKLK